MNTVKEKRGEDIETTHQPIHPNPNPKPATYFFFLDFAFAFAFP